MEGLASWYYSSQYQYGATIDNYPLGTKLTVTNLDNGKKVNVEVVSHGLTQSGRIIDLTLTAFEQIAPKSQGLARVLVEPVGDVLGIEAPINVPAPTINSKAAIAINEKTGEVLFAKNENDLLPLASLTKIMTATVFLDMKIPWDKVITYQAEDNAIGSTLYVSPGETMTVRDLYYSSLIGSANNATNALARSTGLSRQDFVQRMNDKAKEWGLTKTHFVDVTGLDPNNVTTVSEYAILAKNALKRFELLQGTMARAYSFTTINTQHYHLITNKNKLLYTSWYITGTKTGYLDEAGNCLMAKARKEKYSSPDVITVVLGSSSDNQRYQETEALINYALSRF